MRITVVQPSFYRYTGKEGKRLPARRKSLVRKRNRNKTKSKTSFWSQNLRVFIASSQTTLRQQFTLLPDPILEIHQLCISSIILSPVIDFNTICQFSSSVPSRTISRDDKIISDSCSWKWMKEGAIKYCTSGYGPYCIWYTFLIEKELNP